MSIVLVGRGRGSLMGAADLLFELVVVGSAMAGFAVVGRLTAQHSVGLRPCIFLTADPCQQLMSILLLAKSLLQ
jgi:hypothetical protein